SSSPNLFPTSSIPPHTSRCRQTPPATPLTPFLSPNSSQINLFPHFPQKSEFHHFALRVNFLANFRR
ncbi:hypothetical protein LINGRAHAP2_LOCUS3981, partial [Linum grandiflorum]